MVGCLTQGWTAKTAGLPPVALGGVPPAQAPPQGVRRGRNAAPKLQLAAVAKQQAPMGGTRQSIPSRTTRQSAVAAEPQSFAHQVCYMSHLKWNCFQARTLVSMDFYQGDLLMTLLTTAGEKVIENNLQNFATSVAVLASSCPVVKTG